MLLLHRFIIFFCISFQIEKLNQSSLIKVHQNVVFLHFIFVPIDCFNTIIKNLLVRPKPIIFDEVDYLMNNVDALETIRDIHDKTNVPIILVGMRSCNAKLKKYKHLYDRISEIVLFESFTCNDIKVIVSELSEVEFTEHAINLLTKNANRFRQIVKIINKAEVFAKSNGINSVDDITLKEILDLEQEKQGVKNE